MTGCWDDETPTKILYDLDSVRVRRGRRLRLGGRCEVVSRHSEEPETHRLIDLSISGAWIDTHLPLSLGSVVVFSITPPGWDRELSLFAYVRRVVTGRRRGDRGPVGMGVEFHDITAAERAELAATLN